MRFSLLGLASLMGLLVCACGSEETTSSGGGGASSTSSSSGTGGGGDGGAAGGGGSGASEPGPWAVLQAVNMGSGTSLTHLVSALFSNTPIEGSTCTQQEHDPCFVYSCDGSTSTLPPQVHAGAVTVSSSLSSLTMEWTGSSYTTVTGQDHFYADGDAIEFTVSGSEDFPGFDDSVLAPSPVEIDSGSFVPVIHQSEPFTLSWTATGSGTQGDFMFRMTTSRSVDDETVERVSFQCVVPVADGTLTVPLAVTSQLLVTGESGCPGTGCEKTTAQIGRATFADKTLDLVTHSVELNATWAPTFSGTAPTTWTVEP